MGLLIVIMIIPILITIVILDKCTKNKTSWQIMFIGVEITILGVAVIAMGGGGFDATSDVFYFNLTGFVIMLIGFTASIYGFKK
ncbi:hypothetical protein [Clostridium estertheticum]|uniref:hypothetical protein n=1 Tax=Clostridium estertheticum TaxID=238834 RepID=UPI00124E5422|nr:hypothetical protein [Clostridium estertheticum]MBZ9618464.1 hypothetical protein [Clostridium estertheticum subsp. laramiense]WAG76300.1 hypothetical protein LL032_22900 [Clostridium estertheticum]